MDIEKLDLVEIEVLHEMLLLVMLMVMLLCWSCCSQV